MDMLLGAEKSDNIKKVRATCIFWAMVHHPLRNVSLGVVREVPVLRLHQVMLGRHQGLVLDQYKNEHRHKYTNAKTHKYLDHCTCNEHEEKNTLGLHGAVDRLLLSVHHIQFANYDFQLNPEAMNKVVMEQ